MTLYSKYDSKCYRRCARLYLLSSCSVLLCLVETDDEAPDEEAEEDDEEDGGGRGGGGEGGSGRAGGGRKVGSREGEGGESEGYLGIIRMCQSKKGY